MTIKRYELKPEKPLGDWAIVVVDFDRGFFAAVGDRGNYAYLWTDPGGPFRDFLIGLADDPHYLHGKLMSGRPNREVYDGEATVKAIREAITECYPYEAEDEDTSETVVTDLHGVVRQAELDVLHDVEAEMLTQPEVFDAWAEDGTNMADAHELRQTKPEPDCWAFCTQTFQRLVEVLRAEAEWKPEPHQPLCPSLKRGSTFIRSDGQCDDCRAQLEPRSGT
jgi:hypothetical protein